MSLMKIVLLSIILLVALVLGAFIFGPALVASSMNKVTSAPPYHPSPKAISLAHRQPFVDLHADSLLWSRDLGRRSSSGHVDIPRLIETNVAVQMFTVVTKTPRGMNFERNTGDTDNIRLLAILDRWPLASINSLSRRALYQASMLKQYAADSNGRFRLLMNEGDLVDYLEARRSDPNMTAGILGIEGAQALEGRIENLQVFYDAGFRMMSPSHFFDTEFGGSSAGDKKIGLTEMGRQMVTFMQSHGMLVDLAHASPKTIDDVLAVATQPVVVSHTGVKGTCDTTRNLSDTHIKAIASGGGLIGIAFFDVATCGKDAAAIARAMVYTVKLAGVDHVALGSDFDGAVETPFDVTGLPLIIDALLAQGMSEEDIAKVIGGNAIEFLHKNF